MDFERHIVIWLGEVRCLTKKALQIVETPLFRGPTEIQSLFFQVRQKLSDLRKTSDELAIIGTESYKTSNELHLFPFLSSGRRFRKFSYGLYLGVGADAFSADPVSKSLQFVLCERALSQF